MKSNSIQMLGGICAILEALIYIGAFIIFGAVIEYPGTNATATEELQFLSDNYLIFSVLNLIIYVLFGILLAALVIAIHERLKHFTPVYSQLTTAFGLIWVGLVIGAGMIGNIGLHQVIELGATDVEDAMLVWTSVGVVTEGLGGGNEIVGGIWVLLLSISTLKGHLLPKPLNVLGILVGVAGVLTIFPQEIFTEIFGLGQIVWFLWLGIFIIRNSTVEIYVTG